MAVTARETEIKDLEMKLLRSNNNKVNGRSVKLNPSVERIKEGPAESIAD